ncbi:MAG: hypothetical protein Q4G52_09885, partial [Clostridia bacterium]|nr:hypothetical protein [Clostridia bacterium]
CFSPGLVRVAQALGGEAAVSVTAEAGVENAFYARDLSVLSQMLKGMTLTYEGAGSRTDGYDRPSLARDGQTLLEGGLRYLPDGAELTIDGEVFPVGDAKSALAALTGLEAPLRDAPQMALPDLTGLSLAERVPLTLIEAWLSSLREGDAFAFGLSVVEPFAIEQTMSDDGTRLTKLDIRASVAAEGETPWVIEGFIRQPAGRTPKETMEITVTQDEKNFFEISYSSTRQSSVTRKDKAGEAKVDSSLKVAGKLAGSGISSRLTVRMTNSWTADGETLSEKIAVSTTLTHQDKRPGMRMLRLNEVEGKLKQTLRLTTSEGDAAQSDYAITDDVTVEIQMDSNTFLKGSAALTAHVDGGSQTDGAAGDGMPGDVATDAEADERRWADASDIAEAAQRAVEKLASSLYAQLDESTRGKIEKGL